MTEHRLKIKASGTIYQEIVSEGGYFEIVEEDVTGRSSARSVECVCGETFNGAGNSIGRIEAAKDHLLNAEWEEWNLDGGDPLRPGDTVTVHDSTTDVFVVEKVVGPEIELHMAGGVLPIDDRAEFRQKIENTRESGIPVTVRDADGNEKDI